MSPLWPDFAIARAAWDDATECQLHDVGLAVRTEERDPQPRSSGRGAWTTTSFRKAVRHPIRRRITSYAL